MQPMRRFLRRLLEVIFRHLQVVLGSHLLAVTEPRTDNVTREDFFQFCLAG